MFGQIPDFTNSFDFLRKLWATGSGMPSGLMPGLGAMAPPMDLDDVDKRIHDLKAVESWLQLNTNLLRTTIQGLEVQRATLVALQTFGNALSPEAMQSAMENVARAANAPSAHPPQHPHPFGSGQTVSEAQADAENDEPEDDDDDAPPDGVEAAGEAEDRASARPGPAPVPPNASLWWDLLQQQFSQIASGAAAAGAAAAGASPFGGMAGFGAAAAPPGAEGAEPGVKGDPPAPRKAPAHDKAKKAEATEKKAAVKKAAVKKAAVKKPAAKKTAAKSATKGAAKGTTKAAPAETTPATPPKPDTPKDSFE